MSQLVRYQIFVSSTFSDLKDERTEVLQALWELDCIPTGMEAFLATNESQWEVIQKVIDECDYYVLIIGGRYGSLTAEGISYTEKEYNYARANDIPVLAFAHGAPENIPVAKAESDDAGRARLKAFRERVLSEYPVKFWNSAHELGGAVSRSVSRAIKVNPRPGWIRNTGASNLELLQQINELTQQNNNLKSSQVNSTEFGLDQSILSSGLDDFTLEGTARVRPKLEPYNTGNWIRWSAVVDWDGIFKDIGPLLMNEATDDQIKSSLKSYFSWSSDIDQKNSVVIQSNIDQEIFASVIVQFRALGLIDKGIKKRAISDKGSYWSLTSKGEKYLVSLLALRKI